MPQDRAKETRSLHLGSSTLTGVLSFNYYFLNYCQPHDVTVFIRQRLSVKLKRFSQSASFLGSVIPGIIENLSFTKTKATLLFENVII